LTGPTRIARIVAGIVLALRYVHTQGIIHRDLTPDNILLNWDWNVRNCDFGQSISPDQPKPPSPSYEGPNNRFPCVASRYLAPECYENVIEPEGDVFSCGMILYELIVGRPVFPKSMSRYQVARVLLLDDWEPDIPENVNDEAEKLIRDCLAFNHQDRPWFIENLHRLKEIQFNHPIIQRHKCRRSNEKLHTGIRGFVGCDHGKKDG
jgi:serine/threonine protein kinase